jgi:ribosome-associated protein
MSDDLLKKLLEALDDLKANQVKSLNVKELTSVTDTMIIASGRSNRHVRALADTVVETAKQNGAQVLGTEGHQQGEWVLVDLGDIVVHVMQPTTRNYYQLEKLWSQDSPGTRVSNS